jgi:phage-related protein
MKMIFCTAQSGRSYVQDYLNSVPVDERATILAVFVDIEEHGFAALGCTFRQVEGKLWEIRVPTRRAGYRFFYVTITGGAMVILHVYKKQGQRAPLNEIAVAKRRMREWIK